MSLPKCQVCGESILFSRRQEGKDTCGPRCEYPAWAAEVGGLKGRIDVLKMVLREAREYVDDIPLHARAGDCCLPHRIDAALEM